MARFLFVGLTGLFASAVLHAQSAVTPSAPAATAPVEPASPPIASAETDANVVKLSPFTVGSDGTRGYYASNTLSGTRINSKVEDLGASITVVTKQQLDDTAAIDINDIFKYEAGTEGIFNYTATSSASPTFDSIQSSPATATRVRGISAPNAVTDNFPSVSRIPIDTYNLDSVEISRGPSSTLFGLGAPSGAVNIIKARANVQRDTNQVVFRTDSYGGYRTSLNFNRVLLKDRLALRVAALYGQAASPQKPSYDFSKRLFGAFTFQPFKNTTVRGNFESFHEQRQTPNALTPRDGVSEWLAAGRPTWNPQTFTATTPNGAVVLPVATDNTAAFPAGLFANTTTYTRPSMFIDNGAVQLWEINRLGTTANPNLATASNVRLIGSGSAYLRNTVNGGVLYQVPGVTDKGLYDWTKLNAVSTNWNKDRAFIYTAEIEQKIIDNLYARAAWHLEDFDTFNRNITNPPVLQIDVNQTLIDGRANPYFLRPYIQSIEPTIFRTPEFNDTLQAQLVYQLDLTRQSGWRRYLGKHTVQGYYESRHVTTGTFRYREAVLDTTHSWLTPGALNITNGAAVARPSYRYYVGGPGAVGYQQGFSPPKSGVSGNFNLQWYNGVTGQWVSEPAVFGTAPYISGQTRTEDTARGAVLQSSFLQDRLVFTGGVRKDFYRSRASAGAVVDPVTGYYTFDNDRNWNFWTPATGITRDINVVLKPLPWIGLTFHRSASFQPQPPAVSLLGEALPNTYGHGRDVGVYFNLLRNKLVLRVNAYNNEQINDRTSNSTISTRIGRIDAGGLLPGTSLASDPFSLYSFALNVANSRNTPADQIAAVVAGITKYPDGFTRAIAANNAGASLRGTADNDYKGGEIELNYTPLPNWTIKITGAQTKAINTRIENDIQGYLESRLPYWLSIKDDQGNPWWTSTALGAQSAKAFYDTAVVVPLKLDQALLGKSNPQVKEYSGRLLTNYTFPTGRLAGFAVGGSASRDSRSVIGYRGGAPDADGIVRSLDVNAPAYDPARNYFDFWTSYRMKFWSGKIRARFQLNLQNAFEKGRLQAINVNPDGQPYNYRIVNPRKWVLSSTFDF
jgi:outer membrane receptor protein involved in Fe transport